jgi:signal transduction histidine kinase
MSLAPADSAPPPHDEQAELQRLADEAHQVRAANRLQSEFLANVSHELRTPLNAIIGFAELLGMGSVPADSPRHQAFLAHIASSGRHLLHLINDVLDLSKVEAGQFTFNPEPVDLPGLLAEVVAIMQVNAARQGIQVHTDINPAMAPLHLDPFRLKQVLFNYLANAIQYTPAGGQVHIRARAQGPDQVRIEVEDTGIGIAPADLPRLFVAFQQLHNGTILRQEGTGLGLALSRRLVEAQGGEVGVRSELGRGSVFHLVLPRDTRAPLT